MFENVRRRESRHFAKGNLRRRGSGAASQAGPVSDAARKVLAKEEKPGCRIELGRSRKMPDKVIVDIPELSAVFAAARDSHYQIAAGGPAAVA